MDALTISVAMKNGTEFELMFTKIVAYGSTNAIEDIMNVVDGIEKDERVSRVEWHVESTLLEEEIDANRFSPAFRANKGIRVPLRRVKDIHPARKA